MGPQTTNWSCLWIVIIFVSSLTINVATALSSDESTETETSDTFWGDDHETGSGHLQPRSTTTTTTAKPKSQFKQYGESCTITSGRTIDYSTLVKVHDCDINFTCTNGLCSCKDSRTVYNATREKCIWKAGSGFYSTAILGECTENSELSTSGGYYSRHYQCTCLSDYFEINGTCHPKVDYGGSCVSSYALTNCKSNFLCRNGTCACRYESMRYNTTNEACYTEFIGQPCTATTACPKDTKCSPYSSYSYSETSTCKCGTGFIPSADKTQCIGYYNAQCSGTSVCDTSKGLKCISGRCLCKNPSYEWFSERDSKCVKRVGQICVSSPNAPAPQSLETGFLESNEEGNDNSTERQGRNHSTVTPDVQCVPNAECVDGRCQCKTEFSSTPIGTCLVHYDSNCTSYNECNWYRGFSCSYFNSSSSICRCANEEDVYQNDVGISRCVDVHRESLPGAKWYEKLSYIHMIENLKKYKEMENFIFAGF